jgi:CRP/FNR family transcriptional regulator
MRANRLFCDLPTEILQEFETLKYATVLPKGAMLFVEGQAARGVFVLCNGRVKLSTSSSDGKALITQIAHAGEVMGLSATVSEQPYEVTAETLEPSQVNFVKREDFVRFLSKHGEACLRVAQQLSQNYHEAHEQVRSLGLSNSTAEKLARLLLDWMAKDGKQTDKGIMLRLTLTHEEIAQLIGASRETVTRLLSDFKSRELISIKGSSLVIRDKTAMEQMLS